MARRANPSRCFPDALAIRETAKALLVEVEGEERWVPKSCIHDDSEVWKEGDEGTLALMGWFAEKDGW